jgi:hypothetical protein
MTSHIEARDVEYKHGLANRRDQQIARPKSSQGLLSNGRRILETLARATMIDNADYYHRAANACDSTRALQQQRQASLFDLEMQQKRKADQLNDRIMIDGDLKFSRVIDTRVVVAGRVASNRYLVDVEANKPRWMAAQKEKSRRHAAKDHRPAEPKSQQPSASQLETELLTLHIDGSDDDAYLIKLKNVAGDLVVETETARDARYGGLLHNVQVRR